MVRVAKCKERRRKKAERNSRHLFYDLIESACNEVIRLESKNISLRPWNDQRNTVIRGITQQLEIELPKIEIEMNDDVQKWNGLIRFSSRTIEMLTRFFVRLSVCLRWKRNGARRRLVTSFTKSVRRLSNSYRKVCAIPHTTISCVFGCFFSSSFICDSDFAAVWVRTSTATATEL